MSFLKPKTSTSATKLNTMNVSTSAYGLGVPVGWGTFRVSTNLLWYADFTALPDTSSPSGGGKGGAPSQKNYTYTASLILCLGFGPIDSDINQLWLDKGNYQDIPAGQSSLQQAGFSLATGTLGQATWGYLTTAHPTQALGYSELAYLYAQNYALGTAGSVPNCSAEISRMRASPPSGQQHDASPATILSDALESTVYGVPNWPTGVLGSLTNYQTYCYAANLLLSPVLDTQRTGRDFLGEILQASNSDAFMSDGLLQVTPYGDTQITANGVTWTPDLTSVADLGPDDFIPPSDGAEPVVRQVKRPLDCYNIVSVEFLNRTIAYNSSVSRYVDQGLVDQYGEVENTSPYSLHCIAEQSIADTIGPILLQKAAYIRRTFQFTLPWTWGLLNPMDLITLTYGNLNAQPARLISVNEQPDGSLECTAEEFLVGVHHAQTYTRAGPDGYLPNYTASPGNVSTPLFYTPPGSLLNGDLELWIAVAGTDPNWGGAECWVSLDGNSYERFGVIDGGARFGALTGSLASHSDPDSSTVTVDLTASNGTLTTATQAQCDGYATLSLVGTELVAWRDATLTSANHYTLGYFHRGLYGTPIASHTSGAAFVRLDNAIFKYPFTKDRLGQTIYFKFPSFNTTGQAKQALSACTAYTYTLGALITTPAAGAWSVTGSSFVGAGQSPAIIIGGACDDLNADVIIVDYQETSPSSGAWASLEFPITATVLLIPGVIDSATYDVRIRYRSTQGIEDTSAYLDLGPVTVGTIKISNQGLLAEEDAIEDAQLKTGVGDNGLVDTTFSNLSPSSTANYWRASSNLRNVLPAATASAGGIRYIENDFVSGDDYLALSSDNQVDSFPISPSMALELSACVGAVGSSISTISLYAVWYDSNASNLANATPPVNPTLIQQTSSFGAGAGELSTYTQLGGYLDAPSDSRVARVGLAVQTNTGVSTGAKLRLCQPFLSKARSGNVTNGGALTPYHVGIAVPGADNTATAGLGALATQSTVNLGTQVTGTLGTGNAASGLVNSNIAVNGSGQITGIGTGAGTAVANNQISVDGSGAIQGIGTGAGTAVQNSLISLSGLGAGSLATHNDVSAFVTGGSGISLSTSGGVTTITSSAPAALTVTVDHSSPSYSGTGTGTQTTGSSNVSVSGGSGSYTYAWAFMNGTPLTVTAPNAAGTGWQYSMTTGLSVSAQYRCWVHDTSTGAVGFVDVTPHLTNTTGGG